MIYYLVGGMLLVTFIACIIHYFAKESDMSSFFIKDGGWITVSICLTVCFGIIGCVYGNVLLSIILTLSVLLPFIACLIHYFNVYSIDIKDFFENDGGWVTLLATLTVALTVIGSIYLNTLWCLTVGLTIFLSIISATIHYSSAVCSDIDEFIKDENGWVFPLLFVTIASTVICAIYFNTAISIVAGITVTVMIIASIIHYTSSSCYSLSDFFVDEWGWLTNFIIFSIGLTVVGCISGHLWSSIYFAAALLVTVIACVIHYNSSYACDFGEFFVDSKGWLTLSVCGLISLSLYGFIFWEASKTLIVIATFIVLVVGIAIHSSSAYSSSVSEFLYDDNGLLTVSAILFVGYSVYVFAFFKFGYALITVLSLLISIVCGLIHKIYAEEDNFISFYVIKTGALSCYAPLLIGGLLTGFIYSKWWFLTLFSILCIGTFIVCYVIALCNKRKYFAIKVPSYVPKPIPTPTQTPTPTPKPTPQPASTQKKKNDNLPIIDTKSGKNKDEPAGLYLKTNDKK